MEAMNGQVYGSKLIQRLLSMASDLKAKEDQIKGRLKSDIQEHEEVLSLIPNECSNYNDKEVSALKQEIIRRKETCELQVKEMERKKEEVLLEKQKKARVVQELEEGRANSEKLYPQVRYSVNLYRDISHIRWQSGTEANDVTGFINTKSGIKTFRFDKSRQSQFFITNSLWDMGDEH